MSTAILTVYGAVIICCTSAARRAWLFARPRSDIAMWLLLAFLFVMLLLFRSVQGEDALREYLRTDFRQAGIYDLRVRYQAPLSVAVVLAGAAGLVALIWTWMRRPVRKELYFLRLAIFAAAGFLPLYVLRIISLHAIDVILYYGPLHLNWFLEGGLCALAGGAAIAYGEIVKRNSYANSRSRGG